MQKYRQLSATSQSNQSNQCIFYFSKTCQYCHQFMQELNKYPNLYNRFSKICVDNNKIPSYVKEVPTLILPYNGQNRLLSGPSAVFGWLKDMLYRNPNRQMNMQQTNPQSQNTGANRPTNPQGQYSNNSQRQYQNNQQNQQNQTTKDNSNIKSYNEVDEGFTIGYSMVGVEGLCNTMPCNGSNFYASIHSNESGIPNIKSASEDFDRPNNDRSSKIDNIREQRDKMVQAPVQRMGGSDIPNFSDNQNESSKKISSQEMSRYMQQRDQMIPPPIQRVGAAEKPDFTLDRQMTTIDSGNKLNKDDMNMLMQKREDIISNPGPPPQTIDFSDKSGVWNKK